MIRLITRRVAVSIPLLFIVSFMIFILEQLAPGDIVRTILGDGGTPQQYLALRHQLGLDEPLPVQYWHYLDHILHGSLGASLTTGQSVTSILDSRLGVTAWIVVLSTIIAMAIGIPLGVFSAVHRRVAGRFVDTISLVGFAVPHFLMSVLFIMIFAVWIRAFPAGGYVPLSQSPIDWLRSLVLPVAVLALPGVAIFAKTTRDSMRDVLTKPYIRTLRASGISERSIVWKNAFKGAVNPVLSVTGLVFVATLGGTVFVENVFVLPGLGSLSLDAVQNHELYEIEGVALYFTIVVVAVNLLIDIAYGLLNPRVELS
jgi:peptide/nickel transport system permease protein